MKIRENKTCYISKRQRKVFSKIAGIADVRKNFFLTGGTALSVFYLHHRMSEDLDLFTKNAVNLSEIDQQLNLFFKNKITLIKASPQFRSYLIDGIKIDVVVDELSLSGTRPVTQIDSHAINIDTIENIASNKLTCLVSRFELKDLIDIFFIKTLVWKNSKRAFATSYGLARQKEGLLDDPAQAAFQIEQNLQSNKPLFKQRKSLTKKPVSWQELETNVKALISQLYSMQKW
jgi:predicted nucleotidyltransferase component of viral defense system